MNLEYEIDKIMLRNLTEVGELLSGRNPHDGTCKSRGYDLAEKQVAEAIVSFGYWTLGMGFFLDGKEANEFVRKSAGVTTVRAKSGESNVPTTTSKIWGGTFAKTASRSDESGESTADQQSRISRLFRAAKVAMFGYPCSSGGNERSVQDY